MWSWSLLRFVKANELLFGWVFFKSSYNNPFIKHNKIAENRVVIFFGYLQHFHQMPLLLEDLAWLFLDCCVFWTKQDHSRKVWFKYNIARRYFWHNYCWKLIQNSKYMFLLESHHYIFRNLGEITYFCMFFPGLLYDCFGVGWYF